MSDSHDVKDQKYTPMKSLSLGTNANFRFRVISESVDEAQSLTADGLEPTAYEKRTLRREPEGLPLSCYIVALVELCERFAYYGCKALFQNYLSTADGLHMSRKAATALNVFFTFFSYLTPILGAVIADHHLGRYRTIVLFSVFYAIGLLVLWTTALPTSISHDGKLAGFIIAIVTIALGTGGIKCNVAPLIADQYSRKSMAIKTKAKTGERVIIDPALAYHQIYIVYYACIELGSLSGLATPFMEKHIGFWAPFLLTFLALGILILGQKTYVTQRAEGGVITKAFNVAALMTFYRATDAPKPSWRAARGMSPVSWDDSFVDDIKKTLNACKVFAFYPIIWVCFSQLSSNLVSQAGQMETHGVPNDFMQSLEQIAVLVFLPIIDRVIMPLLRRRGIILRPITRIAIGFFAIGLGMAYAAIVQKIIYNAPPCYDHPLACPAAKVGGKFLPNKVHVAIQTPLYVCFGIASIFLNVAGPEYAYTQAPPNLKSFIQSLYLLTVAFGSALAMALVPVSVDPDVLWMFVGVAVTTFVVLASMYFTLRHLDKLEE
ncbi:peptide transporter ptr2 [Metarhizium acridum]|uniref:peptide transporter ptr2 n=1 Tax=Metarhizium acridum TaxID=92637 RepID=UPI001C6B8281|nr:peptide transporter ptr2 [Metarhizium acridum]KAG8426773.1 peptide transporter ptr2 [Metarhizium acridum]